MDIRNLFTRAWAGAVLVLVIVGAVLLGEHSAAILFILLSAALSYEFHHLTNVAGVSVNPLTAAIGSSLLSATTYFLFAFGFDFQTIAPIIAVYPIYIMSILAAELWRKCELPLENMAYIALGQLYIAVPMALMSCMSLHISQWVILSVFVFIWVNDSLAYLTGSLFGRHKLFERISPKKSWEGFVGGNVSALLAAFGFACFDHQLLLWQWLVLAEIIVIFGTIGDFIESLIKRSLHVKDSGNAIPGHGGWLDRFDSFIFAAPPVVLFLFIILL